MFVQYQQFGQLQQIIDETSEEAVEPLTVRGVLTAANVTSKTFQFSVEGQEEIRGTFDDAISSSQQVKVPGVYVADIICTSSTSYATDEVKKKNFLKRLSPAE